MASLSGLNSSFIFLISSVLTRTDYFPWVPATDASLFLNFLVRSLPGFGNVVQSSEWRLDLERKASWVSTVLQGRFIGCVAKDLYGWVLTNGNDNVLSGSLNIVFKRAELNFTVTVSLPIAVHKSEYLTLTPNGEACEVPTRIVSGCRLEKSLQGNLQSYGQIDLGKPCRHCRNNIRNVPITQGSLWV